MVYVQGFVLAVPTANKDAYQQHASDAAPIFREFGVSRMVECWGDDVPDGKVTDFRRSVLCEADETVVFSWFEFPDKATYQSAIEQMMSDPRMEAMGASMPFDAKRMIYAGFDSLLDDATGAAMGYADGFVAPVPPDNRDTYAAMAEKGSAVFREHGATRVVECWGDDITDGEVTDFKRAVNAEPGELIVFSWVEWPSREARVAGWAKVMEDERMQPDPDTPMPFDGKRIIYGGFTPILDTDAG